MRNKYGLFNPCLIETLPPSYRLRLQRRFEVAWEVLSTFTLFCLVSYQSVDGFDC